MSENTVNLPTPAESATGEAAKVAPTPPPLDDFAQIAVAKCNTYIDQYNGIVQRLKALGGGDPQAMLDAAREDAPTNPNETVRTLHERISDLLSEVYALEEQRDAILREQIQESLKNSDAPALKEKADALQKKVKDTRSFLTGLENADSPTGETYGPDILLHLTPMATPSGNAKKATNSQAGESGIKRYRDIEVTVDGTVALFNGKSTFSAAAKVLGYDSVQPLQERVSGLHGAEKDAWPSSFTFTIQDSNLKDREVTIRKTA